MTLYGCPHCGAELQATQELYWTLVPPGNLLRVSRGDDFDWRIYCANDHQFGSFLGTQVALCDYLRTMGKRATEEHKPRPDDDPIVIDSMINRCKDCGGEIYWSGPNASDWEHA